MLNPISKYSPSQTHKTIALGSLAFNKESDDIKALQQLNFALLPAEGDDVHEKIMNE